MAATLNFDADEDALVRVIEAAVDTFDFTLPGKGGQDLGRDLVVRAALGIQQRSAAGLDPDGQDWKPNEEDYAQYKLERYEVDRPGELGGQMLSLLSLRGRPVVAPDSVEMRYGTDTLPPDEARNGVPLKDHEKTLTDVKKARYFTEGGRRFYELDDAIADSLVAVAAEVLGEYLEAAFP